MQDRYGSLPAGIESRQIRLDDHRVHYLVGGSGPPVVLLHGGASDSRDWIGTMTGLAHRFALYAPDIIGFGQSERKDSGYYFADFTDFVLSFMTALGIAPAALVGHSFGARICLDAARHCPEKVNRLVLVDAAGLGRMSRLGVALQIGFQKTRDWSRRPSPNPRFLSREGERGDIWLRADDLPALRVPTLIVWKRHDPYFPLALARRAAALMPAARLAVLPGFGHAPHKEDSEAFSRLLLEFLEDARSPA